MNLDQLLRDKPERFDIPSSRPVGLIRYDDVLSMDAAGATTEAIADALGLSQRAVLGVLARKDKPKLKGDQRARQLRMAREVTEKRHRVSDADKKAEREQAKAERAKRRARASKAKRKPYTRSPEQIEKDAAILRLLLEGEYTINIANRLRTSASRVRSIREANGLPVPPKGRPDRNDVTLRFVNPELANERRAQQDDAILHALMRGEMQRDISRRLHVHARRIVEVRERAGLPAPGRGNRKKGGA
ncbi:hypothetical protein [Microbacterium testaceum]|uniref:hypothetical protein n=1 Tax=Microbacterium testaceum TaxID=2033 RepID=UPI002AC7676D|nr:hypothetical protein [Microbacterium testaceum]MDZ5145341.1 hypothetical protein [Microbacterium testaceum]